MATVISLEDIRVSRTVVPPETSHGFRNGRDETLRVVSVHANGKVIQTDL
jgi:mannose-6-phosphate isomerase-like protein (cupin superfamily)